MFLFRFFAPRTSIKVKPQTEAVISSTVQKNIPAKIIFITRRTSGNPAADEELRFGTAESKSTGSNFSRLLKINFRYNNDTDKQRRRSGDAFNSDTGDRADDSNTSRSNRAWKGPQLRTVCNTINSLNSYRRG
jgi:hypothetical protein